MTCKLTSSAKAHLPFIVLLLILTVYLGAKTLPEEGWSGWQNGSAQTLLSSKHWAEDGFIEHKLLFIPIGYSKTVQYLDEPEMRHHARGTVTGGLIGKRLHYTHYPSGYLIPYALAMKAGIESRVGLRNISLLFSLAALVLMYYFVTLIAPRGVAFFAALYYGLSTAFLDYADSLANQPLDDLLRFAILVTSVVAVRSAEDKERRFYTGLTWALYFILSISSYDSTLFIFVWLVGLDLISEGEGRSFSLKRLAFFTSAPLAAFGIQMLQNIWYLGLEDLLLDITGTFERRAGMGVGLKVRLLALISPIVYLYISGKAGWTLFQLQVILPLVAVMAAAFLLLRKRVRGDWPPLGLLIVLVAAGAVFKIVFSDTSDLLYLGRQWLPWLSILTGGATVMALRLMRSPGEYLISSTPSSMKSMKFLYPLLPVILILSTVAFWYLHIEETSKYVSRWPNHVVTEKRLDYYRYIKGLTENDAVVFYIDANIDDYSLSRANPVVGEYYVGRPILTFNDPERFIKDYAWLRGRSEYPFDAIIMSPQRKVMEWVSGSARGVVKRRSKKGSSYILILEGAKG